MHKVVVVGSSVVDTIVRSSLLKIVRNPEMETKVAMCEVLGGKMEAEEGILSSGGGATNVSVGLRRLGDSVKILSRVGDDLPGKLILDELTKEGVDISMMQVGQKKTGVSAVLVNADGARSIVTYRGESGEIDEKIVDWEMIAKADWLQISSSGGDTCFFEDLINFAYEKGVRVGINPGSLEIEKKDVLFRILKKVEMINLNRVEFAKLFGISGNSLIEIARKMVELRVRVAIMTDGKNGAGLLRNNRWIWMKAFSNKSIDDTGAGDAFVSGVVKGILDNKNDEEILKMGLASGSGVVSKLGAKAGLLHPEEMKLMLKKKLGYTEEII